MIDALQESSCPISDAQLQAFVKNAVADCGRNPSRVDLLERRVYDYHSSFAIEELTVHFANGQRRQYILKNLSPDALVENARAIRPQFVYDPRREVMVYREILAGARLGTATCYAALVDPKRDRYWLLLEKVAGDELYKVGEFSVWCDVARWLARMHSRWVDGPHFNQPDGYLLKYNAVFWNAWIDRAERFAGHREYAARWNLAPRQLKRLADLARTCVRILCKMPVVFLHGEFYASNILIEQRENQTRICPVDWETAGVGPCLIDLAALMTGSWTDQQRNELMRAYRSELSSPQRVLGDCNNLADALHRSRLLLAIKWLGWSRDWQPPDEHRCDWIAEATQSAEVIDSSQRKHFHGDLCSDMDRSEQCSAS